MIIKQITENKKQYIDLLLLADEQESMIDKYLGRGKMFALFDEDLKTICVVTDEGNKVCELKNIATEPKYQGQGYGKQMIEHVCSYYSSDFNTMMVGTGDSPLTIPFYKKCGFAESHRVKNFFTDNYDHPIIDYGRQLVDMIYLKKDLNFDIDIWMKAYLDGMKSLFGSRLLFAGLQGSYGRGEATEGSDIDAVVILDHATPEDLKAYSAVLDTLPNREKVCGFISGRQELINWERSDLFQFYYDTTPVFGSIDFLRPLIRKEDVRRAIRIGACNIYHMCGHNMVHEKDAGILKSLYKSAAFTVQAIHYDRTGTYIKQKTGLIPALQPQEQEILQAGITLREQSNPAQAEFERLSEMLFNWAAELIIKYKAEPEAL